MSMNNNNNNNISYNNKNKKKKFFDFRVWTQKYNLTNDQIIEKTIRNNQKIKDYTDELNEEEDFHKKKKIDINANKNKNNLNENEENLSENIKEIKRKVSEYIKSMNNSTEELKKLNALYLINTSKKVNKSKNLRSQTLPPINNPYNKKLDEEKDEENILHQKKNQPVNFKYINENYRKQLNRAFLNFNPIIHLGNLNMLRKADPAINEDIEKLTKHIEDDLHKISSPNYYRDQYEKVKKENEKIRRKREETKPTAATEPNVQTSSKNTQNNSIVNVSSNNIVPSFNRRRKKRKTEIKKKFPDRDIRENELNLMDNVLNKIDNTISDDNMNNYYKNYKILRNFKIEDQKHNYFPGMEKAALMLKEIQSIKIIRNLNEETVAKKKMVMNENEKALESIINSKNQLLHEIEEQEKK